MMASFSTCSIVTCTSKASVFLDSTSMHTCKQHSTDITDPTSAKISGTQTPEYQKIQENFDTIIRQLGAAQAAEELADKLFTKKLITSETRDKASLATLTSAGKMRVLIPAVMGQVEIDPANYHTFLTVLRAISGAEHMADYLERKI